MSILHDLTLLFNAIFFGLNIFLTLILWNQKTIYRFSNRFLSALLIAFAITTFNTIIRLTHYIVALDVFQDISNAVLLTMGPSIFVFLKIRTNSISNPKLMLHYVPFFIYSIILVAFALIQDPTIKVHVDQTAFLFFSIQLIIYLLMSFRLVNIFEQHAKQNFSNLEKHHMGWVRWVLVILLAIWVLRLLLLIYVVLIQNVPDLISLNLTLILSIVTSYLGYKIFKNQEIFVQLPSYGTSKLSDADLVNIQKKIDQAMMNGSLFLNPSLTISELAKSANLHTRQVSQTLTQHMKQNFYDYVNGYRVQVLIEQLKKPQTENYKLSALMEEAGFKSTSVAYAAFKKVTGNTPTQYRKSFNLLLPQ